MPKPRPPRPDRRPGRCPAPGPAVTKVVLGFIELTDAAPVIIAKERGLFDKYGLTEIAVARHASWRATRDKYRRMICPTIVHTRRSRLPASGPFEP
jgi:NMT1-like family